MKLGDFVTLYRDSHDLSQRQFANICGLSNGYISMLEKGINPNTGKPLTPTLKQLKKLAQGMSMTLAELFEKCEDMPVDMQSDEPIVPTGFDPMPATKTVPRIGRIACGDPITAEENIDGYDSTLDSWNADFTLLCVGDSMAPKIVDGDVVAIRSQPTVENGEIAAVRVENEATLKQVFFRGKYLELRPINPNYESLMFFEEEMNQVHIEGKAVGLCRGL